MTQLTDNIFEIPVPDDAAYFEIMDFDAERPPELYWDCGNNVDSVDLPPGNWQYLFFWKGCTKEQAAIVVDYIVTPILRGYRDYDILKDKDIIEAIVDTPQQSLASLLRSKGLNVDDNYAFLKLNTNE